MSMYQCATRTNYFQVNDEEKFRELMGHVVSAEDKVELFEKERDGVRYFAFGCYSSIEGVDEAEYCRACGFDYGPDSDKFDDDDYNENREDVFITMLQSIVAENDAIIIMQAGREKLRYVTGIAEIITRGGYRYVDLRNAAINVAQMMLGNSEWTTQMEY